MDENFRSLGGAISPQHSGERLDYFLAKNYPFLSRAKWQKKIAEGIVYVNGTNVKTSYLLRAHDIITLFHPPSAEPKVEGEVTILYEHQGVLCAYKPPGIPMHENGPYRFNTFYHFLKKTAGKEWAAIHRLDRETSGVVLCAATYALRKHLTFQLRDHKVRKEYLALARGVAKDDHWLVDAPIGRLSSSQIRIKRWVSEDGETARTAFSVLERAGDYCLLQALPATGRTNQIRIHAAYSGLPLVGDRLFHADERVFLQYYSHGLTDFVLQSVGHSRVCLHASGIGFKHPVSQESVFVDCPMHPDMQTLWQHYKMSLPPSKSLARGPKLTRPTIDAVKVGFEECNNAI